MIKFVLSIEISILKQSFGQKLLGISMQYNFI